MLSDASYKHTANMLMLLPTYSRFNLQRSIETVNRLVVFTRQVEHHSESDLQHSHTQSQCECKHLQE